MIGQLLKTMSVVLISLGISFLARGQGQKNESNMPSMLAQLCPCSDSRNSSNSGCSYSPGNYCEMTRFLNRDGKDKNLLKSPNPSGELFIRLNGEHKIVSVTECRGIPPVKSGQDSEKKSSAGAEEMACLHADRTLCENLNKISVQNKFILDTSSGKSVKVISPAFVNVVNKFTDDKCADKDLKRASVTFTNKIEKFSSLKTLMNSPLPEHAKAASTMGNRLSQLCDRVTFAAVKPECKEIEVKKPDNGNGYRPPSPPPGSGRR